MEEVLKLFASIALDPPGSRIARQLAKVQVSSLLRTLFPGDLVVWRNFPEPLYPVERKGLHEMDFQPDRVLQTGSDLAEVLRRARMQQAASLVEHAERYEWVILADPGVMALRNWDHLFENKEGDVLVVRDEKRWIDPSLLAIRGRIFETLVRRLEGFEVSQAWADALNTTIETEGLQVEDFERGEVVRVFEEGVGFPAVLNASVVLFKGGAPENQAKVAFALHMMKTFGDRDGLFLDLLES